MPERRSVLVPGENSEKAPAWHGEGDRLSCLIKEIQVKKNKLCLKCISSHFKPFFWGGTQRENKISKIFHTFCRRGGGWLFLEGFS